jgi:hypothetical protein
MILAGAMVVGAVALMTMVQHPRPRLRPREANQVESRAQGLAIDEAPSI